jgi:hypothetical protein
LIASISNGNFDVTLEIIPFTCALCGARFAELRGGKCARCGKVVCRHHFFRGWWKGWKRFVRNA